MGMAYSAFALSFCGFLANPNHMSTILKGVMHFSAMYYMLEALFLAVYQENATPLSCPASEFYCHFTWVFFGLIKTFLRNRLILYHIRNAAHLIKEMGYKPGNYQVDLWITVLQVVVFKFAAYFALKRKIKNESN